MRTQTREETRKMIELSPGTEEGMKKIIDRTEESVIETVARRIIEEKGKMKRITEAEKEGLSAKDIADQLLKMSIIPDFNMNDDPWCEKCVMTEDVDTDTWYVTTNKDKSEEPKKCNVEELLALEREFSKPQVQYHMQKVWTPYMHRKLKEGEATGYYAYDPLATIIRCRKDQLENILKMNRLPTPIFHLDTVTGVAEALTRDATEMTLRNASEKDIEKAKKLIEIEDMYETIPLVRSALTKTETTDRLKDNIDNSFEPIKTEHLTKKTEEYKDTGILLEKIEWEKTEDDATLDHIIKLCVIPYKGSMPDIIIKSEMDEQKEHLQAVRLTLQSKKTRESLTISYYNQLECSPEIYMGLRSESDFTYETGKGKLEALTPKAMKEVIKVLDMEDINEFLEKAKKISHENEKNIKTFNDEKKESSELLSQAEKRGVSKQEIAKSYLDEIKRKADTNTKGWEDDIINRMRPDEIRRHTEKAEKMKKTKNLKKSRRKMGI